MSWSRPVPLIGDTTSAIERERHPEAWAFPAAQRDALRAVLSARRDVRRFRPAAVTDDLLTRVLAAAHMAPSVGHSQPWRFIVVRDPATRDQAALLADRERLAQAAQFGPDSARRLLDLQLEGIREAPSASWSVVTVAPPPMVSWVGPATPTPTCGRAPVPSRTCGWRREPRASAWAG